MQVIFAVADLVGAQAVQVPDGEVAPAYLYVRSDDVGQTITRIAEAGGRPLSSLAPRSWGEQAAWFADLDGNVVAVAESLDGGSRT